MERERNPGCFCALSYRHLPTAPEQEPDNAPGNYYVSVQDNGRFGLLLGPFPNDHRTALARVAQVRQKAEEMDPRSVFYGFGTCRMPPSHEKPGRLNDLLATETGT